MRIQRRLVCAAVALCAAGSAGYAEDPPVLVLRGTYATGLVGDNAEIISIRHHDAIAVISNTSGSVDILDLSDPDDPTQLLRVPIDMTTGTPNSVAIHPVHDYFLVVTGRAGDVGTVFAHRVSDGTLLDSASVGIQPDSVVISPNGQFAVVVNEAEAVAVGNNGGAGSLSIIDLSGFNGVVDRKLVVTNLSLPSIAGVAGVSSNRTDDIGRLPVDNSPGTLEPENIAFSKDSRYAFITLQENNAIIRLEVRTREMWVVGAGTTTHAADLVNGGGYVPTQVLTAFREPDGIAVDQTGRFFVTADEGDTRNSAGAGGPRGGRTVSVFDARTGAFLADTGRQLDDQAADPTVGAYPDDRSERGGSEPEGVDLTHYRGVTLAAVALERASAIALVDVSDPAAPSVVNVTTLSPQIGPESAKFYRLGSRLFIAASNEVTGTVSILEVVF